MANYYASARSNYFRVKDKEKFIQEFPGNYGVTDDGLIFEERNGKEYCCILFDEGIETWTTSDETGKIEDINWATFFAKHLEEDSVAVFFEAGSEKLRYIIGMAEAYNHKGDCISLNLRDIYFLIQDTWGDVEATEAEY
jgi:hypothetical protein